MALRVSSPSPYGSTCGLRPSLQIHKRLCSSEVVALAERAIYFLGREDRHGTEPWDLADLSAVVLVHWIVRLVDRKPDTRSSTCHADSAAVTAVPPTAKDAGWRRVHPNKRTETGIRTCSRGGRSSRPKGAPAPAQQNSDTAPSQTAQKETAPEPAPQPTTTAPPKTAEQETPPKPAATASRGAAPASEMEAQPASASAPADQTAAKDAVHHLLRSLSPPQPLK